MLFFSIFQLNSQIFVGFTAGINGANIRYDNDYWQQSFREVDHLRYGYNVGVSGNYFFSKVLSVEIDFLYTLKGFTYKQTYISGFKQFNYGQVNAAGQLVLNPDSDILIAPYLSPYLAYWISGKKMETNARTGDYDEGKIVLSSDTTFAYNRYDMGLTAGVDFMFEISRYRTFILGAKYEHGMISTDIEKVDGWRNKNFSIYFRYMFKIKK